MLKPQDLVYGVCQHYINDQHEVDEALRAHVDGFRRARDIQNLSSCSSLFDTAKHCINEWRFLRQIEAFFKKNAQFAQPEICIKAAASKFEESEVACRETNARLRSLIPKSTTPLGYDFRVQVFAMQRYISNVLGEFHKFASGLPSLVRVTPGATAQSSRRDSLPQLKMKLGLYATASARSTVEALYAYFGFSTCRVKGCESNRIELVPKNWKTYRTIACEPEGNLPLQLAFDTYAKRKLKKFGIDLGDQSKNQIGAREGSVDGTLCTVDFASASDTISYQTVRLLFPDDWFTYLDGVRSSRFRGKLGTGEYEKFSSMGNGSTFCIETLIFSAACHAVGSKRFLVYGDDVLIEKERYPAFLALTAFLGFSINVSKTFIDGPFRESCGKDYFNGVDVTPVYIRGVDQRKASLCHLVNSLGPLTYPEGELLAYLKLIQQEFQLPFVPFSENTMSGVWLKTRHCHERGILVQVEHSRPCNRQFEFKAFVPETKRKVFVDSRGYYLWFLSRYAIVRFGGPWAGCGGKYYTYEPPETSKVPIFQHRYVRKWVGWQPAEKVPDHLDWWS